LIRDIQSISMRNLQISRVASKEEPTASMTFRNPVAMEASNDW
jgi:hypothetical protein